jgi:hypothetical protein
LKGPFPSGSTVKLVAAGFGVVEVFVGLGEGLVLGDVVACPWIVVLVVVPARVPVPVVTEGEATTVVVALSLGTQDADPPDCRLTFRTFVLLFATWAD